MANQCSSSLKSFMIIVAASFILCPLAASGESMTFVRTAAKNQEDLISPHNDSLKKMRLTLENDGNVMVRYGGVSCTVSYGSSSHQESKEQPGLASSNPQIASLGGINLKIGITF